MQSSVEVEITALHKNLRESWSAWRALNKSTCNNNFIEEIIRNYDKFEKKIKMRILLSLLMLDNTTKSECALSILKLLELARYDSSDLWLRITAGIVHEKLFENRVGDIIEETYRTTTKQAVDATLLKLKDHFDTKNISNSNSNEPTQNKDVIDKKYFDPLEHRYLSTEIIHARKMSIIGAEEVKSTTISDSNCQNNNLNKITKVNIHFTYNGEIPNFYQREVEKAKNIVRKTTFFPSSLTSSSSSSVQGHAMTKNPMNSSLGTSSSQNSNDDSSSTGTSSPIRSQSPTRPSSQGSSGSTYSFNKSRQGTSSSAAASSSMFIHRTNPSANRLSSGSVTTNTSTSGTVSKRPPLASAVSVASKSLSLSDLKNINAARVNSLQTSSKPKTTNAPSSPTKGVAGSSVADISGVGKKRIRENENEDLFDSQE